VQLVAVALHTVHPRPDTGGLGAPVRRGEGVGAGVDHGDVVAEPASGTARVPLPAADVEDPQRAAGRDERVEGGPDGRPRGRAPGPRRVRREQTAAPVGA
jgi:hypothetical protein